MPRPTAVETARACGLPILNYHFLTTAGSGYRFRRPELRYVVDRAAFAEQLAALASAGYTPTRLAGFVAGQPLPRRPLAVTLDDGHASALELALGVLQEQGFEATFFIATDLLDTSGYLSRAQLLRLREAGMEIGSHGCSHRPLTALPAAEMADELRRSRDLLEQLLGGPVSLLSLPHGFGSRAVGEAAREAGYRAVCASSFGVNRTDQRPWLLHRIAVGGRLSTAGLLALLRPGTAAYGRALAVDRLKRLGKWAFRSHMRCD